MSCSADKSADARALGRTRSRGLGADGSAIGMEGWAVPFSGSRVMVGAALLHRASLRAGYATRRLNGSIKAYS